MTALQSQHRAFLKKSQENACSNTEKNALVPEEEEERWQRELKKRASALVEFFWLLPEHQGRCVVASRLLFPRRLLYVAK